MSKNKKKKKKVVSQTCKSIPTSEPSEKKQFICLRCGFCCIHSTPSFTREEYKIVRDLKVTRERNVKFTKYKFETLVNRFNNRQVMQAYSYFTENGLKTLHMGPGGTLLANFLIRMKKVSIHVLSMLIVLQFVVILVGKNGIAQTTLIILKRQPNEAVFF